MKKNKILFISQEITPYLPETEMSKIGRILPQGIQEKGKEIRTFMPKYGCINERRNQLHEVIRLSGMNLIINDTDHPLIIKVASIQSARMQVYFIDNDDYFQRRNTITDDSGNSFPDNDERSIFFSQGVFETVKKLRWKPDLIYCQGWLTSLIPLYLKKEYADDPAFTNTKVVFSAHPDKFAGSLSENFAQKIRTENIEPKDVKLVKEPTHTNVNKLACSFADGIILYSDRLDDEVCEFADKTQKPVLVHSNEEKDYIDTYNTFFDNIIEKQ